MALRVAIVGFGPRGLFALERLIDHAHRVGARAAIDIDLFEPHPTPGAGPVYDPAQPAYLRMNIAADRLTLWPESNDAVPASERLSFAEWARASGGPAGERYPPRAMVGRYLADGLERIRRRIPPGVSVTLRPLAVRTLRDRGERWAVTASDRSSAAYDEVLVAVGHGVWDAPAAPEPWSHAAPFIPSVFPVAHRLTPARIAPGAAVAVRGFALTFIDAALAMTEGRGGVFDADDHPYRLRYAPSADDVDVMLPFSRTGRPMLAKPDPELAASVPDLCSVAEESRERILALPEGFDLRDDLLAILAGTVAAGLLAANGHRAGCEQGRQWETAARRWLSMACDGLAPVSALGPRGEIERSLDVGAGLRPPDLPWALGQSWQSLYPALVTRLGGAGLPAADWPAFTRLAAEMERVAFGPPPVNAAKLLALITAGRVDLSHVCGAWLSTTDGLTAIGDGRGRRPVDAVVDAVLPAPGIRRSNVALLPRLIADGYARIAPGRRGLEVADDATCVGRGGSPSTGLSAIGRSTEDWVIGNDTLSRTLHPQADRWARRVADRARERARPECGLGRPRDEAA